MYAASSSIDSLARRRSAETLVLAGSTVDGTNGYFHSMRLRSVSNMFGSAAGEIFDSSGVAVGVSVSTRLASVWRVHRREPISPSVASLSRFAATCENQSPNQSE